MKNAKDNKDKATNVQVQKPKSENGNKANKGGVTDVPDRKSASNKNSGPSGENL